MKASRLSSAAAKRQLPRAKSAPVAQANPGRAVGAARRACLGLLISVAGLWGCEREPLPHERPSAPLRVIINGKGEAPQNLPAESGVERGSLADNLPFEADGKKLASIAWRTWVYTDTGPKRTRLGYLRAGAVLDARGPLLKNEGCSGGWLRINPRGFVCLGKGATTDLTHPVVQALQGARPRRHEGFPYTYARSRERSPDRYFRLPTEEQMTIVEGENVVDRGANWIERARKQGLLEALAIDEKLPTFLDRGVILPKPYGVDAGLRAEVSAGRTPRESGFALIDTFLFGRRGFGLTTELDLLPLDRLQLVEPGAPLGIRLQEGESLPVAFHVRGALTVWKRTDSGAFIPAYEQREKRGYRLTGVRETGGMLETTEGVWLAEPAVRIVEPRDSFPSVATGRRKWIDVSIKEQVLVAYEGQTPRFVTLISSGRGGLGDPETEHATIRGTFMIHHKEVSGTMDGDDDRADSYSLQDVPFVQYFHRGFALHGAYWHDDFGRARSHGCVNLSAFDAAYLFDWTDPPVPDGWHAALNKERGTVVYVHP